MLESWSNYSIKPGREVFSMTLMSGVCSTINMDCMNGLVFMLNIILRGLDLIWIMTEEQCQSLIL